MPRLPLLLLPPLLLGCSAKTVTEIVVVIASDIPVSGADKAVNKLNLQVHYPRAAQEPGALDPSTRQVDYTWDLDPAVPGAITLPAEVGLLAGKDLAQPVLVTVRGLLEEKERIRRQAQLLFVRDRIVMLRMNLLKRCLLPVGCEARATCGESGCEPIVKDSSTLPVYEEKEARKPYLDAGPRDAPADRPGGDGLPDAPRPDLLADGPRLDAPPASDLAREAKAPDLPRTDAPKPDAKKLDGPKPDAPKPDAKKPDGAKADTKPDLKPPSDLPKPDGPYPAYKQIDSQGAPLRGISFAWTMTPIYFEVVLVGDGCTIRECTGNGTPSNLTCATPNIATCTASLRAVTSPGNTLQGAFAVGENGTIMRRDPLGWVPETSGTSATLHAVLTTGTATYAAGENLVLERVSGSWTPILSMTESFRALAYGSKLWAVTASGKVFEKSASGWNKIVDAAPSELRGVAAVDSTIAFTAAGTKNTIISYTTAALPETSPASSSTAFNAVHRGYQMSAGPFRVAVGSGGAIVRSTSPMGGAWTPWTSIASPTSDEITAVRSWDYGGHLLIATVTGKAYVLCPYACP